MKPTMPKPMDGYAHGRAQMPHVMALNKDPTIGLKNNRQPPPRVSNVTAFAKGGKVQSFAKGGAVKHADAKQDKKQIKAMVKKDCIKPMKKAGGGKVQKPAHFAAGGAAKVRKKSPMPKPIKKVSLQGG